MGTTYVIPLTPDERAQLEGLLPKGQAAARGPARARLVLQAGEDDAGPGRDGADIARLERRRADRQPGPRAIRRTLNNTRSSRGSRSRGASRRPRAGSSSPGWRT
jgi:hypothetical protein